MVKLVKPKSKEKKVKIKLELSSTVWEELKQYQEFIGEEDTDYVIQEAVKQILDAKVFKDWKKEREEKESDQK